MIFNNKKSTIYMHIGTAMTIDDIITRTYKISNNNNQPTNFKDYSKPIYTAINTVDLRNDLFIVWRHNLVTKVFEEFIPVSEICHIAYCKNENNDSYVRMGKVTKIGLFLCEIKMYI
jgi:hypothetical protein